MRRGLALLVLLALAGCGSSAPRGDAFDDAAGQGCMDHQHRLPDASYTRSGPDVAHVFDVLKYYTADGSLSFCDGKGATSTDLAWMRFYVGQGADPSKVARWLH